MRSRFARFRIRSAPSGLIRTVATLQPGRPAVAAGLRMAVTIVVPTALGMAVGHLALGLNVAMGAFYVGLTDDGGPYPRRVRRMCAATVILPAVLAIAMLAGLRTWTAVAFAFVCAFACGLTNIFTSGTATVGLVALVACALGVGLPGGLEQAMERCLPFLAGGALSVVLSNALWPIYPWRPVARSVATAFRALADAVARLPGGDASGDRAVADARDGALAVLAANRPGRRAHTRTGDVLLSLLRIGERVDQAQIAIRETLAIPEVAAFDTGAEWKAATDTAIAELARSLERIADAIDAGGGDVDVTGADRAVAALAAQLDGVRLRATTRDAVTALDAHFEVSRLAGPMAALVREAACACAALAGHHPPGDESDADWPAPEPPPLTVIRQHLTLRSAGMRHALRLAATTAIAVLIGRLSQLGHGYWIILTVVVVLKPTYGVTIARGVQRVAGTVLGAVLASALVNVVRNPVGLLAALGVFTFLSYSVQPLNYGLFTLFVTPMVVLLLGLGQSAGLVVVVERAVDTAIGGILALLGGYVLWPTSERQRLPETLGDAADALRRFSQAALGAHLEARDAKALRAAAGGATLAVGNADTALQRLMGEPRHRRVGAVAALAFVGAARRLRSELSTLALHARDVARRDSVPNLRAVADQIDAALADIGAAVRSGRPPAPLASLDGAIAPMRERLIELHDRRASELRARLTRSATRDEIADVSLTALEVTRMAADVEALHAAATRLARPG